MHQNADDRLDVKNESPTSDGWMACTPLRVSFGGGGTDFEGFYKKHDGFVVSATIDFYITVGLEIGSDKTTRLMNPDGSILSFHPAKDPVEVSDPHSYSKSILRHFPHVCAGTVTVENDLAMGTGLGSSGSMGVSLVGLLSRVAGYDLSRKQVAELAYEIEHDDLGRSTGKQDHYAAAFGGFNKIHFRREGIEVEPISLSDEQKTNLRERVLLFSTGIKRDSSVIVRAQEHGIKCRNRDMLKRLDRILQLGRETASLLEAGDLDGLGEHLHRSWLEKRLVSGSITNHRIDDCYEAGREAGALGGKICGAGGGGVLMLFARRGMDDAVRARMADVGLKEIDFSFEHTGLRVESVNQGRVGLRA